MNELLNGVDAIDFSRWNGAAVVSLRVVAIAVVAWILAGVLSRAIRLFRTAREPHGRSGNRSDAPRRSAACSATSSTVVVTLIAGVLILSELGMSVAPILGAAGVVGIAVGFGAQSLVKDYFTGFFLLLENQLTTGDVVQWPTSRAWSKTSRSATCACATTTATCTSSRTT